MSIRIHLLYLLFMSCLVGQEDTINLAFEDLSARIVQSSPQQNILIAEYNLVNNEKSRLRQWSNPEINFTVEQVTKDGLTLKEHSFFLSKSFDMPWLYWQDGNIWQKQIEAAEFEQKQGSNILLADIRSKYVRLKLLNELIDSQSFLNKLLNDLDNTVKARLDEGAISLTDAALLSMSIFAVESDLIRAENEIRHSMSTFKQILGIEQEKTVILISDVEFMEIGLIQIQNGTDPDKNFGLKAHQAQLLALEDRISLEKSRVLPSIYLEGGYKKINPGWEGFVAGFSLPLPVLNWNGTQTEERKLQHQIQLVKTAIYRQKLAADSENLIETIRSNIGLLNNFKYTNTLTKIAEDLKAAYLEGAITLPEFLSAIQIYRNHNRQYVEQMAIYYKAIFELESLSGSQFVTF